jgi:hypothetical protein
MRRNFPTIPNFNDVTWQARRTDAQLVVSILEGKGTDMPPAANKLSRSQVLRLVAYVRMFAAPAHKRQGAPASAQDAYMSRLAEEFAQIRRQLGGTSRQ